MRQIPTHLLYATNIMARDRRPPRQVLAFSILIHNTAFEKRVAVHWAGEDGHWHELQAEYRGPAGKEYELWSAWTWFPLTPEHRLPGDIEFAVGSWISGREHWDNNHGRNYELKADSGVRLGSEISLVHIGYKPRLHLEAKHPEMAVAVHSSLNAQSVALVWSLDHGETWHTTQCTLHATYWDHRMQSNARNPNQYGVQVWTAQPEVEEAESIEYRFDCQLPAGEVQDTNFGSGYRARRKPISVLTLNLHCYQEQEQEEKFSRIARAIDEVDIDIICFQEVGENWNWGRGDWSSNAARIIRDRLYARYFLYTDWSHRGFDRFREGSAILSKYPFVKKEARYVSRTSSVHDIHSRKVLMTRIALPLVGEVNVFCVHLSWWKGGFATQFEHLWQWVEEERSDGVAATLLCGDFNVQAGSPGYSRIVSSGQLVDQYLQAVSSKGGSGRQSGSGAEDGRQWENGRIDYVFMDRDSAFRPLAARELFTAHDRYGRVSDHVGYYLELEPT